MSLPAKSSGGRHSRPDDIEVCLDQGGESLHLWREPQGVRINPPSPRTVTITPLGGLSIRESALPPCGVDACEKTLKSQQQKRKYGNYQGATFFIRG